MVYEVQDYVVMSKSEFLAMFGRFIDPEKLAEFQGGYYDGDTMRLQELGGIEVGVEINEVVFRREDYEKALKILEEKKRENGYDYFSDYYGYTLEEALDEEDCEEWEDY